jgi:hypothetical protein
MLKITKSTHLIILSVLSMIFVMIYLYYMIQDIKKMDTEIKRISGETVKITQDIQNLVTTISTFNKDLASLKKPNVQCIITPGTNGQCSQGGQGGQCDQSDIESVGTEDIQKILGDDESEAAVDAEAEADAEVETAAEAEPEAPVPSSAELEESLKKKKYEEIKELCKNKGISQKGTKDQLIAKLVQTICT